jgi:hypothetical protein
VEIVSKAHPVLVHVHDPFRHSSGHLDPFPSLPLFPCASEVLVQIPFLAGIVIGIGIADIVNMLLLQVEVDLELVLELVFGGMDLLG